MQNRIGVEVRAEGRDGYVVVFRDPNGHPHDVKRFGNDQAERDRARAYRDGFADGLVRGGVVAAAILNGN